MNLLLASTLKTTFAVAKSRFPKPLEECHVVCIPTAANVYAEEKKAWFYEELEAVKQAGARFEMFDLVGKSPAEVAAKMATADVIYATGGNVYYLMEHMQKCRFQEAILPFMKRRGVYVGASAGAVVACHHVDYIGNMDNTELSNLTSFEGLALVPFLVMPHIDHPKYAPIIKDLLPLISATETVIALTDSQALWVSNNVVELIQA